MFFLKDPLTDEVSGPVDVSHIRQLYAKGGYELWELSKSNDGPWTPLNRVKGLGSGGNGSAAGAESRSHVSSPSRAIRDDVVYCRVCGRQGAAHAVACLGCGVPPGVGDKYCNRCGIEVQHPQAVMCVSCGSALAGGGAGVHASAASHHPSSGASTPREIDAAAKQVKGKHGDYYKNVFAEISKEGGGFKAYWNWTAFLLGPFYFLYHGLIIKALMLFVVGLFFFPASWLYAGIAFNYDLYLKKVKGKDLW